VKPNSYRLTAVFLLVFMFGLSWAAALRESPTVDEVAHIGAGLSYLQRLDLRMNAEHPPLAKLIAAVPLAIRGTYADYQSPAWTVSESFIDAYTAEWIFGDAVLGRWNPWRTTLLWARLPMMLFSVWLGWIIYLYATRLGGEWGGLLCLAVFVGTPVFLAIEPLVITDIPTTLFTLIALWQVGEISKDPSSRNSILLALALAAALLSKFTGLILFGVIPIFLIASRLRPAGDEPLSHHGRRLRWRALLKCIMWACLIVYAVYFIFSWNQPLSALERLGNSEWTRPLRRALMPIWLYLRGVGLMLFFSSRSTFLLGRTYPHGVPFYFPVVFVLKSALGFLALLAMAAVVLMVSKIKAIPSTLRSNWRALMVGFFVFTITCLASRLNISVRHFSVPHVLLILMLAPLPRMLGHLRRPRVFQALAAVLAISCLSTAARSYPWFMPYVNSLSLGRPAYTLMNGANVDWNQDLPLVSGFVQKHQLQRIRIDVVSLSDPALIVPQAQSWDCQAPATEDAGQWAVVSATVILEAHNCGWLQPYLREELGGGSMYTLQLPQRIPKAGEPGGPPLAADQRLLFGTAFDLREFALEMERHPEKLPAALADIARKYYPTP
jgi:hypothetical protein